MRLIDSLEKTRQLQQIPVPELRYIQSSAERIRERWPEIQLTKTEREREAQAQRLRDRVERADWEEARLSSVISGAFAVFDPERRERTDLCRTREFLCAEAAVSTSETFLSGLFHVYLDSFVPEASHSVALATALSEARPRTSSGVRRLLESIPEFLDPITGPARLAGRMVKMTAPYADLFRLGVRNPHGSGFMDFAHIALTSLVRPQLSEQVLINWYIKWLRPPAKVEGRTVGAEIAIEALIHPWLKQTPDDTMRSFLIETLIELYGDPRIKSGGVWGGISDAYMAIVYRWLTREDMRFFTGVVDASQDDAMWPPRRDFWLKLYDEGLIDAAWAALSSQAFEYARRHLMRRDAKNAYTRVGFQRARQNTSLLVMKIGNKIMVDGCHSYRTHVFDISDPMAPRLFEEGYDCEEIMRASDQRASGAAKSHSSIPSWSRWVRDMINADIPWSRQTKPYSYVGRPRSPKPRSTPPPLYVTASYLKRQAAQRGGTTSPAGQDLFRTTVGHRSQSGSEHISPAVRGSAVPASDAAAGQTMNVPPKATNLSHSDLISLKQNQFANLTDRMIAYGPEAAAAVLAYLEAPSSERSRTALSPNSRKGLAWVQASKDDLPLSLRNSLEHLLIGLKTSGVDLEDLFASAVSAAEDERRETRLPETARTVVATKPPGFPPLPELAYERINLLRTHADALEEAGRQKRSVAARKDLAIAIQKLREGGSDLRPWEIADLQALYGELRQSDKGGRA